MQGVPEQMLVAASSSSSDAASDYWAGSSQQPPAQMVCVIELLVNKIDTIYVSLSLSTRLVSD